MKLKTKLTLFSLLGMLLFGIFGICPKAAYAAEGKKDYQLTISPAKLKIGELEPGKKYTGTFEVMNEGAKPIDYEIYTTGYQVKDESYDPVFEDGNYTMISKWITYSQTTGHLDADETDKITYTIIVPNNAPAGGQYASIMVSTSSAIQDGDTVGNVGRLSLVVYSHVAGETVNCAKISNLSMNTFLLNPPLTATALVENCGNVDVDAEYTLRVFPLFSDEEIYTNAEGPDIKTVLPGTKRLNSISWENSPSFGIFRAEHTVKIGDQIETISSLIVICPIWVIVLIILFIGASIFWLVARNRSRKQKKQSV